jgi:type IV fimbrial biogenesis protein FimT
MEWVQANSNLRDTYMNLHTNTTSGTGREGFTLMELVVTVGILAVIASLAVPSMMTLVPSFRLKSAAREIVSCFQEARVRAIKENAVVVIIADLANDRLTAFVDNGPGGAAGNWALDAAEAVVSRHDMSEGVDLYFSTIPFNTFGYNGRGLPAAGTGNLRIRTAGSDYRRIDVNAAGSLRVLRSADGVNWN